MLPDQINADLSNSQIRRPLEFIDSQTKPLGGSRTFSISMDGWPRSRIKPKDRVPHISILRCGPSREGAIAFP